MRRIIKGRRAVLTNFVRGMECVSKKIGGGGGGREREKDERRRRNACSKMLAVAGVADWSRKKRRLKWVGMQANADAHAPDAVYRYCCQYLAFLFPLFYDPLPYLVFPDRIKRAFINAVPVIKRTDEQ